MSLGECEAVGLCGSGLLDLTAALLDADIISESGYLAGGDYQLCPGVTLTQKDVREVQLAKGAIRAGIELLAKHWASASTKFKQSIWPVPLETTSIQHPPAESA